MTAPGHRLRLLAARVCSPQAMERLIDPTIVDLRIEHAEALREHRRWRARWLPTVAIVRVLQLVARQSVCRAGAATRRAIDESTGGRGRSILSFTVAICSVTAFEVAGPIRNLPAHTGLQSLWLSLFMLPSAMTISLPVAVALTVAALPTLTGAVGRRIALAVVACTVVMFVTASWIVPVANQQFRVLAWSIATKHDPVYATSGPRPGPNELTLPQLKHLLGTGGRTVDRGSDLAAATYAFHVRIAACCSTMVLCPLVLVLSPVRSTIRVAGTVVVASLYFLSYVAVRNAPFGIDGGVSPAFAAWLPNVMLMAATLAVHAGRMVRTRIAAQ
jgi:hypothetical protein